MILSQVVTFAMPLIF